MNAAESTRFAVHGVTANKLRSALTTLGILIGVAAVIILVAVGTGSSQAVQDSISRLGSNTLDCLVELHRRRRPRRWRLRGPVRWRGGHRHDHRHQDPRVSS